MTGVTSWKQWKNSKKIMIFVFPIHRPSAGPPALAPNLYLTALSPIYIYQPWCQICIYQYWPQIVNYQPWSVGSLGLHIPTLSPLPQFVFIGPVLRFLLPCSEFTFTFLSIAVAVAVVILAIATFHTRETGN